MKSFTSREANKLLERRGQFWMEDYFDRYVRNYQHFQNAIRYIENNPVKAKLCLRPEDWPFGSASRRAELKCWERGRPRPHPLNDFLYVNNADGDVRAHQRLLNLSNPAGV
jgi:hypothetical protein